MNQNYNQDSFNKGQAFEDYVEQVLFPASHYELLHKTNTYDQNSQRYVGDSRKPDFRFKCILTGFEFHVEAKYRSNPFNGYYDILSPAQVLAFPEIHQKEIPIYIALGYGGDASDPSYISLVHYGDAKTEKITIAEAVDLQIPKQEVNSNLLIKPLPENEPKVTETTSSSTKKAQQQEEVATVKHQSHTEPKKKKYRSYLLAALLIIAVIAAVFYIPTHTEEAYKNEMKTRITKYYALSDANNLKELDAFISPQMSNWYGIESPTTEEVIENIKEYRDKFPFSKSTVDWKTFDVTKREEGGYYVMYLLEYKVKSKLKAPYRAYDLKLLTTWDSEMRLMSITEVKR